MSIQEGIQYVGLGIVGVYLTVRFWYISGPILVAWLLWQGTREFSAQWERGKIDARQSNQQQSQRF